VDTETTSLNSFKDGKLFSIIISIPGSDYYFNFKDYPDEGIKALTTDVVDALKLIFSDESKTWFLTNAKFDMHMLAREGLFITGKIYDLYFLDRIHFNQHMKYSLDAISGRWGEEKLDIVMKYIIEHDLKTHVEYPELNKSETLLHFDRVPFSIIQPYGEADGKATLETGLKILEDLKAKDAQIIDDKVPKQMQVVEMESRLVHTLFRMEQRGVKLDISYCKQALNHYLKLMNEATHKFKELTGVDFVKGTTVFEEVFASEKDKWEQTEKGNWKWDNDIMSTFDNPAARVAQDYAEAKKQSEYFANFLHYSGDGVLHANFQQAGTVTGRLSCRDPNLQNLTNPDKYETEEAPELYSVRKSFIPREGFFFVMPDYSQVEFRILLDIASANNLINEVLDGHDVHTATSNVSGTTRKEAKTTNFLTAYGGGVVKLAQNLYHTTGSKNQLGAIYKQMFGWRLSDAEKLAEPTVTESLRAHNIPLIRKAYDIQQSIFRAAPEIKDLLKAVQRTAENRGYVRNWLGRRYQFNDKRWCYRAPNHLIQGAAAEVIKIAMNRIDDLLMDYESKMILTIHDELIFEVKFGEEHIVDKIKDIMESVYPCSRLPLLVDVEFSYTNLCDKSAWPPEHLFNGKETGNSISN
jgi:DNA polymerase-1